MLKNGGVFINGISSVSPLGLGKTSLEEETETGNTAFLKFKEPVYSAYIEPNNIRRMSRLLKISLVAAKDCLADSNILQPDGIITGTGIGCMEDTEKFLKTTFANEGVMSSPTAFIHSTHNTISSQIAIALKCTGYNSTYVHRFISFENALIDCCLQLKEGEVRQNFLLGGMDEMTEVVLSVLKKIGFWKENYSGKLYENKTNGTIAGEGCAFFTLSNKRSGTSYAEIKALKILYKPKDYLEINIEFEKFLSENNLMPSDIDLLVSGNNGDARYDHFYEHFCKNFTSNTTVALFKHICGEYFTSSAFGLMFSSVAIKNNKLPSSAFIQSGENSIFKNMIFYNQSFGANHCFYLLSNVEI